MLRKLQGAERASFPLEGSQWFNVADDLDEAGWRARVRLLDAEQQALSSAVEEVPIEKWSKNSPRSKNNRSTLVQKIESHDLEHPRQIQLWKRLREF